MWLCAPASMISYYVDANFQLGYYFLKVLCIGKYSSRNLESAMEAISQSGR